MIFTNFPNQPFSISFSPQSTITTAQPQWRSPAEFCEPPPTYMKLRCARIASASSVVLITQNLCAPHLEWCASYSHQVGIPSVAQPFWGSKWVRVWGLSCSCYHLDDRVINARESFEAGSRIMWSQIFERVGEYLAGCGMEVIFED